MTVSKIVTRQDIEAALTVLDQLDNRLTCAEVNDDSVARITCDPSELRGDFCTDTINTLRAAFTGLWRLVEATADEDELPNFYRGMVITPLSHPDVAVL